MFTSIERVAVLGAGALGATYASQFFRMDPEAIMVVASGHHYERLKRDGVFINDIHIQLPVVRPDEAPYPADLIIVALKHHQLLSAVHNLAPFVKNEQFHLCEFVRDLQSHR